jgi:DNA repair protein RadC
MALKDCIKKLGKALTTEDRELLEGYLEQGLSDNEAIERLNLVLDKKLLDISLQAKRAGAGVKVKRDAMAEIRQMGEKRLEILRNELANVRNMQDLLSAQREEVTWVESNIKHWEPGGGAIDLTNSTQVYMRFEQMGFVHKDAFKRGEFGDSQIKGKNTYELVQSFRDMQQRGADILSEIHGLILREAEILEEMENIGGRTGRDFLNSDGSYRRGPIPPEGVNEEIFNYSFTSAPQGKPWKLSSSGEGDLDISRHGAKAGTPHKERQGPNDFAITFDESVLLPDYAFYLLQYLQPKIAARAHGTAQQAVNKKDIEDVLIEHFRSQAREDSGTFYTQGTTKAEKVSEAVANYKALVKVVAEREINIGITKITSPADAAHVLADIRKNASEGMWAVATDDAGNVVGVVEHSRGTIDGTSVYPSTFAGAIITIPGATKVWFAHNHPSGTLEPSQADERITRRMNNLMDGSGVQIQGHVLMGLGEDTFTLMAPEGHAIEWHTKITPARRNKRVKVFTRRISGKQEGEVVRSPADTEAILNRMGNPDGVLLLNNRHRVLGFMAMTPEEMEQLKDTGGSNRLLRAFSELNAAAFIVSTSGPAIDAANNMASFAQAGDVRMLDAIYKDSGGHVASMANQGVLSASQTFYQSNIGFTSGLLTAARTMPQEKGTADQMLALLKKQPGVTKAEMEWLDIEDWFEAKGGTVTRQEIIDYVDANGIVVEEIQHRGDQAYQGMSLPGARDKRDIFLKMPEVPEDSLIHQFQIVKDGIADEHVTDDIADEFFTWINTDQRMADVQASREGQGDRVKLSVENVNETQYDLIINFMMSRALTLIDEQTTDFRTVEQQAGPGLNENFGFSHFSYKNILAWMRTTERIGPNGERILMIEEVQSDWHQKGGRTGYREALPEIPAYQIVEDGPRHWLVLNADGDPLVYVPETDPIQTRLDKRGYRTQEEVAEYVDRKLKLKFDWLVKGQLVKVPDAPFKGRGWPKLAMKRMIRLAAEEGFDQIAWTTGEQQNMRNNLGAHVEELSYDVANQTLFVQAVAGEQDRSFDVAPEEFEEYMGADAAAALRAEIDDVERFYEPIFDEEEQLWTIYDGNAEIYRDSSGDIIYTSTEDEAVAELWKQLSYENMMPSISGDQLDYMVGEKSQAMPNFYDRELANLTKDAARKLDKNAKVELEGQAIHLADGAPYTAELARVARGGLKSGSTLGWYVVDYTGRHTNGPFEEESMARGVAQQNNDDQALVHTLRITDQMREAALEGQTLFQKKKGSISFDQARKGIIKLTKSRDLSTFLHEAGHLYLEIMGSLAEQKGAPKQIIDDYQKILEYLGVKNRAEITREHHELWAESFEKYLQEGNAPSVQLQSAFNAFRRWLSDIWARITGDTPDGIALTPEIRDVMDRILASDEQIAQAKIQQEFTAIFSTAEEMGVSQEVFEAYRDSLTKENNDAIERETKRLMAAANRDRMTWWKEERAKVRAEVEAEAHKRKVYQAISLLGKGTQPDGSPLEQGSPFKINKQSLVDKFGKDFLRRLPKPWVYTVKGGVDVDVAARQLGYRNGTELIEAMVKAPAMKDWIDYNTDQIMQAQYPDPMLDGSIADEAIKAVHNERRGNILAAEMRQLRKLMRRDQKIVSATKKEAKRADIDAREANRASLPKRAEMALIKVAAKAKIGAMRLMDVQPHKYLAAERKAGRLAFEAAARKDYQKAYVYKRQQVVNHEMYRAAQRAKDNAEKTHNYLSKFSKPRVMQRLGKLNALDPILAILEGIELRKVTLKEINRRNALQDLAQQIHDGGIITPIAEHLYHVEIAKNGKEVVVLNEAPFTNWQELTVDEFEAMRDIIKQLEFQADKTLRMNVNGEIIVLEEATTELEQSILESNKIVDLGVGEHTRWKRTKKGARSGLSHWLSPSVMANVLDNQGWGAFTRLIVVNIRRAVVERLIPMQHEAINAVSQIYRDHYTTSELRKIPKKGFAEINGETLSLSDVLSIALNHGNEGNRQALFNGIRVDGKLAYPEAEVEAALAKLTERDWLFVQAVWDYLDTYWPAIAKMEKERRGIAPERVEPTSFVVKTADGKELTMRGGYYPLKYNYEHSARGESDVFEDHYKQMGNGTYVSASTRAGATHNRVKNHKMVVQLGLHIIDRHLKEITRDMAMGNEVNFVQNLLNDSGVRNAMQNTNNHQSLKELKLWLADVAVGELPANNEIERWMGWARVGFTKSKLAFNLYTAALQLTGYAQSVAVIGAEAMTYGAGNILKNPVAAWKLAFEASAFMKSRYDKKNLAFNKDINDAASILKEYGGGLPTMERRAWQELGRWMFLPIAKMQQLVDLTTWHGAYWKARNKMGQSDSDAVLYADAQVELAQTSGYFSDRSGIERGTLSPTTRQAQFVRLWTTLISYMARKGNLAYMKGVELGRDLSFKNSVLFATDMLLMFTLEGIASAWIYGRWDWEDDPEELMLQALKETANSVAAGIPFVREVPSAAFGSGNTAIGGLSKDLFTLYVQAQQGEMDPALRKAFVNSFGTIFHLPASQTNRLLEALIDEDDPELLEYFTGTRD